VTLQVQTAASGVARSAHYVTPTGQTLPIQTLLLEPQRTNLCIRSEEFDTWTDSGSTGVTANTITAPDGTTTADLLTSTATGGYRGQSVTFSGDGEKSVAIYLRAGSSTRSRLTLRDTTASVSRHEVRVTWTAGVPTLSTVTGAGTLYPVESLLNGWYRILFTATGIVAANTHQVRLQPDDLLGTGTVYAWGAQAENAVVPSSYIKTEGTTITRNADSLYFPFTAPPQAMTVYVRGVERGTRLNSAAASLNILSVSNDAGSDPILRINCFTNGRYQFQKRQSAANVTAALNNDPAQPNVGEVTEFRGIVRADGSLGFALAKSGGAEVVGTDSSVQALESAWSGQRLFLNSNGLSGSIGQFAFTHVVVATGEQSLSTMRQLAGVV